MRTFLLLAGAWLAGISGWSQPVYSPATYPDEAGFQRRTRGVLEAVADLGFGARSKAFSYCPDTGNPVYTWALEGETVISPYTGRTYLQGPTGYFGPKSRDSLGRIQAFGGDPLKYDLPPATAAMMLDSTREEVKHFLSIPGNLRQQYHFACKNWVRFYGLAGKYMPPAWHEDLALAVGAYREARRPSDGEARQWQSMSYPHDLVGQPGYVLGGNNWDGGTENHKTMWRTSGWLYAQWLPPGASVSGYPRQEADSLIRGMLFDYLNKCFRLGNGEYHSPIYYPHAINGYLNLFDFALDPEIRNLAQAQTDFYLATYALKSIDGVLGGAARRGYLSYGPANEMEKLMWMWTGAGAWDFSPKDLGTMDGLPPATSAYRPNQVIWNLAHRNLSFPFEAEIAHPAYHLEKANQHQEKLFVSRNFVLGFTTIDEISNPYQQVVWSLTAKSEGRPYHLGGGQPKWPIPSGHSSFSQTLQKNGAMILLSGQNIPRLPEPGMAPDRVSWFAHSAASLQPTVWPASNAPPSWESFFTGAGSRAETWFFMPAHAQNAQVIGNTLFFQMEQTLAAVHAIGKPRFIDIPADSAALWAAAKSPLAPLKHFHIWVISGAYSGFALDVAEFDTYGSMEEFIRQTRRNARLDLSDLKRGRVRYRSLYGNLLDLQYHSRGLKADGRKDGIPVDYARWADGGVYDSPYLKIKNGVMTLSDGSSSYQVRVEGQRVVWSD